MYIDENMTLVNNRCQLAFLAAVATTIVDLKEKVKAGVIRVDENGALKLMSISKTTRQQRFGRATHFRLGTARSSMWMAGDY